MTSIAPERQESLLKVSIASSYKPAANVSKSAWLQTFQHSQRKKDLQPVKTLRLKPGQRGTWTEPSPHLEVISGGTGSPTVRQQRRNQTSCVKRSGDVSAFINL